MSPLLPLGLFLLIALCVWIGTAIQRYEKSLLHPSGRERDRWLRRALDVAVEAERLLTPYASLRFGGSKFSRKERAAYVARLRGHMHAWLRNESVSITLDTERVLLLLASQARDDGSQDDLPTPAIQEALTD